MRRHNIDTIAVLSIFAGVVFAFTGGFTMLGNVFTSISTLEKEQTMFFLGCAMTLTVLLYDVIYMLMSFSRKFAREKGFPVKGLTWSINVVGFLFAVIAFGFYFFGS